MIQDGVPGYHTETFMVRADSGIKTPADIKGKRVGTNAVGSASDTAMRAMLAKAGLQDRRDYVSIEAAFPALPAMLEERQGGHVGHPAADAARAWRQDKDYAPLFTARDAWGPSDLVFLVGRSEFLDKNRAAMEDFFEDYRPRHALVPGPGEPHGGDRHHRPLHEGRPVRPRLSVHQGRLLPRPVLPAQHRQHPERRSTVASRSACSRPRCRSRRNTSI